ncbi:MULTISPECIES: hypothetical protein [Lacticaseibacillus]|uniref:hypothetical protein n=1 Tax=Lacticaseibacillus TaxID=2759736 RepID=UPI00063DA7BD|nr:MULTISPECIES: hypothetical protein [Lacticaseibacillus]KLI75346.1 hypothetical protein AAW28_07485 [Lacticaseibacillus casei]
MSQEKEVMQLTSSDLQAMQRYKQAVVQAMGTPDTASSIVTAEVLGEGFSSLIGVLLKGFAGGSVAGAAGMIASTISGMMSVLDAQTKSDEYQAASQGLNVINSLVDIFNNHPDYTLMQVQLSVIEWYSPETGTTMAIIDGTADSPSDAYVIQRIQLNSGNWLDQ